MFRSATQRSRERYIQSRNRAESYRVRPPLCRPQNDGCPQGRENYPSRIGTAPLILRSTRNKYNVPLILQGDVFALIRTARSKIVEREVDRFGWSRQGRHAR